MRFRVRTRRKALYHKSTARMIHTRLCSCYPALLRGRDRLSHMEAIVVEARGGSKGGRRSKLLGRESPRQSMNISHHRRLRVNIFDLLHLRTTLRSHDDDRPLHTVCRAIPQLSLVRQVKSNAIPHPTQTLSLATIGKRASSFAACVFMVDQFSRMTALTKQLHSDLQNE